MRIYEICWHTGEKSWVCANSAVEAIRVYCKVKDMNFDEFDVMDDIRSVPLFKWHFLKRDSGQSFYRYMRNAIRPGLLDETFNHIYT